MHRCSIDIQNLNYASLCDLGTTPAFLRKVARAIGIEVKGEPFRIPKTRYWFLELTPHGWMLLEPILSGTGKGCFILDICSEEELTKEQKEDITSVIDEMYPNRDSLGQRTAKRTLLPADRDHENETERKRGSVVSSSSSSTSSS